ncbi:MAG: hypothetical protein ACI81W_002884, partial [Saprospiraceae bacterium]
YPFAIQPRGWFRLYDRAGVMLALFFQWRGFLIVVPPFFRFAAAYTFDTLYQASANAQNDSSIRCAKYAHS